MEYQKQCSKRKKKEETRAQEHCECIWFFNVCWFFGRYFFSLVVCVCVSTKSHLSRASTYFFFVNRNIHIFTTEYTRNMIISRNDYAHFFLFLSVVLTMRFRERLKWYRWFSSASSVFFHNETIEKQISWIPCAFICMLRLHIFNPEARDRSCMVISRRYPLIFMIIICATYGLSFYTALIQSNNVISRNKTNRNEREMKLATTTAG